MTIIAAIDFSPTSLNAARTAARLARKLGDKLLLVRVLEPVAAVFPELAVVIATPIPDLMEPLRTANRETLKNMRESLMDEGVAIEARLLEGRPASALVACAQEENARLIVMGTHGRGAVAALFLGSVAQATVLHAPCPVLVLREGLAPIDAWVSGKRPLRILVGVDRTAATAAALAWIGELRKVSACDVVMVHEYWPPAEYARLGLRGPRELGQSDPEVVAVLERELGAALGALPGKGEVTLQVRPSWERVGSTLAHEAEVRSADLIVVGTHQPHAWDRVKMGSSALATLQAAKTAVLCVPGLSRLAKAPGSRAEVPVIRSVLVATDLSPLGNAAVAQAYALLRGAGGVVEICHVHEGALPSPIYAYAASDGTLSPQHRNEVEAALRALVPAHAADLGITTHVTVIEGGQAAEQIVQAARRLGADVIVTSSHGRSGLGRTVLGSVAESIVRHSERPVHVVRGPQ
jgi:nucleotide-binding universal stress UspA family protein